VSGDFVFLKSRRFWVLFTGANLFLNIGYAFAYVLSDRYVAYWHDNVDPINEIIAGFAGLLLVLPCWLLVRKIYGGKPETECDQEWSPNKFLVLSVISMLQFLPVAYLTGRIILMPLSVSHYESPSVLLWILVGFGTLLSGYERSSQRRGKSARPELPSQ